MCVEAAHPAWMREVQGVVAHVAQEDRAAASRFHQNAGVTRGVTGRGQQGELRTDAQRRVELGKQTHALNADEMVAELGRLCRAAEPVPIRARQVIAGVGKRRMAIPPSPAKPERKTKPKPALDGPAKPARHVPEPPGGEIERVTPPRDADSSPLAQPADSVVRSPAGASSAGSPGSSSDFAALAGADAPAPNRYTEAEWRAMVAEAAYLRAERRGFVAGSPEQDWLEAEDELRRTLGDQG